MDQIEALWAGGMDRSENDYAAGRLVDGQGIRERLRATVAGLECSRPWAAALARVVALARAAKAGPQTEEDGFRFGKESAAILLDAGFSSKESRDYIDRIVVMVAYEDTRMAGEQS